MVLVFGAADLIDKPGVIRELVAAYPQSHVIGCSTAGEILDTTIRDDSISVAVCRFDDTTLRSVAAPVGGGVDQSRTAGRFLADALAAPDLRGVLVISDGIQVNGSELLAGLNEVLPSTVVVTGGLAGDGDRFKRTWIINEGTLREGHVSAIGFYGTRICIGHGSKGGWDIFGPERVVTKSVGNVLFEIDGRPALTLYKEYLGERAAGLPATALLFPLALRSSRHDPKSLVRTILSTDEATQSMTFAGNIPQGSLCQLMRANFERLIDGASEAARATNRDSAGDGDCLAIAISCVGRRLVLGQRCEEEVEAVKEALPGGAQL
ncbi:MAG: FIST N-terminal domain-containing protein, partial [Bacteroidota bacterium]